MSASFLSPKRIDDEESGKIAPEHRTRMTEPGTHSVTKTAIIGGGILLALLLTAGILPRLKRHKELSALASEQQQTLPLVDVVNPRKADATNELVLPATTQAIQETTISARTSGYIRRWLAGMGQQVKEGQLLAEIDSPETDQQLREARQQATEAEQTIAQARSELSQAQAGLEQAEASLKQARTNLELARVNLERSKTLVAAGVVSHQDTDDKQAAFDARQADVEVAQANIRARQAAIKAQQSAIDSKQSNFNGRQANVQRLVELQSYQKVVAPYDGIITARNVEVGALINASGGTATNAGLYRIARLDTIRIFINVPQTYVAAMRPGLPAEVMVKELPQKVFTGNVIGTSNSIDPATRTLMVEVRVSNPERQLLSGMYAQVKFVLPATNQTLMIPASGLIANAAGTQVLVMRPDHTVHFQKVEVGRDSGKEVEIISGLSSDQWVVTNPSDNLREGTHVQPAKPDEPSNSK